MTHPPPATTLSSVPDSGLLPHLGLIVVPGRRARTLELAQEIERRGFPGIWSPSGGNAVAAAQAILEVTTTVVVGGP